MLAHRPLCPSSEGIQASEFSTTTTTGWPLPNLFLAHRLLATVLLLDRDMLSTCEAHATRAPAFTGCGGLIYLSLEVWIAGRKRPGRTRGWPGSKARILLSPSTPHAPAGSIDAPCHLRWCRFHCACWVRAHVRDPAGLSIDHDGLIQLSRSRSIAERTLFSIL